MAVNEINAKGGINGKQVQLVAEDTRCTAGADGANAAQELVNVDKGVAIVGGLCSSETLAASSTWEETSFLLLYGKLPPARDLEEFKRDGARHRRVRRRRWSC